STGDKVKRGPITKTGNRRARRMLVECAWSYQFPPQLSKDKQVKVEAVPQAVREIAWKGQSRLNQRYRGLLRRGKLKNIAITAVAREFVGFIWAVAQAVGAAPIPARPRLGQSFPDDRRGRRRTGGAHVHDRRRANRVRRERPRGLPIASLAQA